jgi:hypothetical protein
MSDPSTAERLLNAYSSGQRRFAQWDLAGADLQGAVLDDANFFGANLSYANLSGAHLARANLGNANLQGADLSGADLTEAFTDGAALTGANLTGAIVAATPKVAVAAATPGVSGIAAPVAGPIPVRPKAPRRGDVTGGITATVGGAVAVLAFFLFPYAAGGSDTGFQTAVFFQQASTDPSAYNNGIGQLIFVAIGIAALGAIVGAIQWGRGLSGHAMPTGLITLILLTGLVGAFIELGQLCYVMSVGGGFAVFGLGYWFIALGLGAIVVGAVKSLTT